MSANTNRCCCRDARNICLREYGSAPEVVTYGVSGLLFPYIPHHLHHIVFELTKNSLRAVAEHFADSEEAEPPIRVVISRGDEDITIKVPLFVECVYACMLLRLVMNNCM
jgi:pyruvate dehydrogenase kinase 2/3/4